MLKTNRNQAKTKNKTTSFSFRCNKEERIFIKQNADKYRRTPSDFVRESIIHYIEYLENKI